MSVRSHLARLLRAGVARRQRASPPWPQPAARPRVLLDPRLAYLHADLARALGPGHCLVVDDRPAQATVVLVPAASGAVERARALSPAAAVIVVADRLPREAGAAHYLDGGADDYVAVPICEELAARVRAQLRRRHRPVPDQPSTTQPS